MKAWPGTNKQLIRPIRAMVVGCIMYVEPMYDVYIDPIRAMRIARRVPGAHDT